MSESYSQMYSLKAVCVLCNARVKVNTRRRRIKALAILYFFIFILYVYRIFILFRAFAAHKGVTHRQVDLCKLKQRYK